MNDFNRDLNTVSDRSSNKPNIFTPNVAPIKTGSAHDVVKGDGVMRVSRTRKERIAAFELVYQMYRQSGLSSDNPSKMRVLEHHLLDTTSVMVSKREKKVDFTISLVQDGNLGMPAESLFSEEIKAMRGQGLRLAEISCLASGCDQMSGRDRIEKLVKMVALTFQVARRRGVDRLLLVVHPRHAKVYRRMFGCMPCTDVREYKAVQGNPAVLCVHDFAMLDEQKYSLYDQVYATRFDPWEMDGIHMSNAEKRFFRSVLAQGKNEFVPMVA
ncbi:N-acyl amino acid synthase FeeM domain-containing protein [Rhodopirellula sp. JC639]|uniref:N-acyl amino acid synthase FeeM domain-containing protein n=1 Tax=Stieleria mannarensis TaxID=2755585 RepID=UPI00160374DA|nr:hypothetical protein [Rhodopirellula sp. JC639]